MDLLKIFQTKNRLFAVFNKKIFNYTILDFYFIKLYFAKLLNKKTSQRIVEMFFLRI